ncbi:LPS export ABC transporter permease LptF [Acidimangrovimonas sediminis]|uniref:LPS export ABC transporter permease LptF n=1 Tax=Acidimangrovimonas sediminis TaxID=2056283 RepID=UPI000C80C3D1|nr:LPS export ABC transporter permease LptF [Acidimangrovimonas sediminis]
MSRFDRYMLSQLMALFGFFSLVLVLVYWVNQAVLLFDRLIGDGQTALVFLEFTALSLPNSIRLVLPVSAFAATVYVTNRLTRESELVVAQSTGMSSFRLARGVLAFGIIVALLLSVLVHVLVPASRATMAVRQARMDADVTSRILTEGKFLHPSDGITIFIRHITPDGELKAVFLSDGRSPDSRTTYTANHALLVNTGGTPKLVMFDGMAQTLHMDTRRLSTTRFKEFTYEIGSALGSGVPPVPSMNELSTWTLLHPTPAELKLTGKTAGEFWFEGNTRLAEPLNGLAATFLGFAVLMVGAFSRFGLGRQIFVAIVLLIVMQLLINAGANMGQKSPGLWGLTYVPAAYGMIVSVGLMWWSQRRRWRPRDRSRPETDTGGGATA